MAPILQSLPYEWEKVVWINGRGVAVWAEGWEDDKLTTYEAHTLDISVYGRYKAIAYASNELIYVQDDDVIVSHPQAIVDVWDMTSGAPPKDVLVANMPQEFRHEGYTDSCLIGFGACFHRDAIAVFADFLIWCIANDELVGPENEAFLERTCDVIFTTLNERVLVDIPKENMPYASDDNRMWRQPTHVGERTRMLELARRVRAAR